jgi:NAD kinase
MKRVQEPRFVLIRRKTSLEHLLEHHGTHNQACFFLAQRSQTIDSHEEAHQRFHAALRQVDQAMPSHRRRTRVDRDELDRFFFAPDDVVVVVGQDGLVANVAKYLVEQQVFGVNPDPERYDGILCPHPPSAFPAFVEWNLAGGDEFRLEQRTQVIARREDGQTLPALNEVFVGHRTHQSARYHLDTGERWERHSSSGLICATGTGATGWARSISTQRRIEEALPMPEESRLAWFVREPFPSVATGTDLDFGFLTRGARLRLISEMGEGGVVFADGIESDYLEFVTGQILDVEVAPKRLQLVMPGGGVTSSSSSSS